MPAILLPSANVSAPQISEARALTVVLQRRPERDAAKEKVSFSGYDIKWPDGRPVSVGLSRFCQQGTRLLLGRAKDVERALLRITFYPVPGLEAAYTRPGPGIRCRRFFALRQNDQIRFHFFTGHETEIVFDRSEDDAEVLHWLHEEQIKPDVPFWFDLASQFVPEGS
jgi:hypothetical protein